MHGLGVASLSAEGDAWTVSRVQHLSGVQPDGLSDGLGLVRGLGGSGVLSMFGLSTGYLGVL